jgi:flavin-dependent dehydrogenase
LRALANAISQKDKTLLNKRVRRIEHSDSGVTVHCDDGSSYHGDMVVGCDGINSKASTRTEMYRLASATDPEYFSKEERTSTYGLIPKLHFNTKELPLTRFAQKCVPSICVSSACQTK